MSTNHNQSFGATIRRERERAGVTLRRFATLIGVSPTYLSKIERGELPPPAEDKIVAIAKAVGLESDVLLAVAHKLPADIEEHMLRNPGMVRFLRTTVQWPPEMVERLLRAARAIAEPYEREAARLGLEGQTDPDKYSRDRPKRAKVKSSRARVRRST